MTAPTASLTRLLAGMTLTAGLALAAFAAPAQDAPAETVGGTTLDGATLSAPAHWVHGQTLTVTGENWTTTDGNRGSVIGVKYDQGTFVPTVPVDEMDDIWLRITAANDGSWTAEMPWPEDAGWTVGETHRVHFLTGLLGVNDPARNPVITLTIVDAQ